MKTGNIILVPFPFTNFTNVKVRPCVVICETKDRYKDLVVSAISSIVPNKLNPNEIILSPNGTNNLRVKSIIKTDRIVTLKSDSVITRLGKLEDELLEIFIQKFKNLIDNNKGDNSQ